MPYSCPDCGGYKMEGIGIVSIADKPLCETCAVRDIAIPKNKPETGHMAVEINGKKHFIPLWR